MVFKSDWVNSARTLACALALAMAGGLAGCNKKVAQEDAPAEEAPAPKVAAATPEPKPVAPVAVATPPPATPAPELAPPGVFYLISAVSVETSDGILGLKPGQLLKEVRPGVYRADNNEVTLRPEQVTNDLAIARRFAAQDQVNQAAIQQRLATTSAPATTATQPSSSPSASPAVSNPPAGQNNAAAQARQELFQQLNALRAQSNNVSTSLSQVSAKYGSNWEVAAKRSPQAFQLLQQYNALQRQMTEVSGRISQIQ